MDSRPGARAVFAGALIIVLAMASIVYVQLDLTKIDMSACDVTLLREGSWSVMKLVNRVLGAFVEVNSCMCVPCAGWLAFGLDGKVADVIGADMQCEYSVPSPSSFPSFDESLDGVWSEA